MSAKDPDVRSHPENALLDQLARSEERIDRLEAQLAQLQRPLPAQDAGAAQTPAPSSPRPPILMSAFNENLPGQSTQAVAAIVRTAANVRNMPVRPQPAPDKTNDGFEPTARLDTIELRHAHRTLAPPRPSSYRRIGAGLLCLACGTLCAGVWQMRPGERHNPPADAPQSSLETAPAAQVYPVQPAPVSDGGRYAALDATRAAPVVAGRSSAPSNSVSRLAHTPRSTASAPVGERHHAQTTSDVPHGAATVEVLPDSGTNEERRLAPPLPRHRTVPTETVSIAQGSPKTRAIIAAAPLERHPEHNKIKAARLVAFTPHAPSLKLQPRPAVVSSSLPQAQSNHGPEADSSVSVHEQAAEQAAVVHETRTATSDRDDRRDNGDASVDHAIRTLDKMKALLDNMEQRHKSPAHP